MPEDRKGFTVRLDQERAAASFGGVEFYPDLEAKTAILASRIIRNHPLPDGNKRVGYLCVLEFVARNGGRWTPPSDGPRRGRDRGDGRRCRRWRVKPTLWR